jgi:putative transposase
VLRHTQTSCSDSVTLTKPVFLDFTVEVVRRIEGEKGFHVLPRRWVVKRSFGWLTRYRRRVRDYEQRLDVSEAMIYAAMASMSGFAR